MIRVERDARFWIDVIQHPAVEGVLGTFTPEQIAEIIARPTVLPLAAQHGGFLFSTMDVRGRVRELHTAFTPEGWGREVYEAAREAFEEVFDDGAEVVLTYEIGGNPRSRPPLSFGFRALGEMRESPRGDCRLWHLTHAAWLGSPARRMVCH